MKEKANLRDSLAEDMASGRLVLGRKAEPLVESFHVGDKVYRDGKMLGRTSGFHGNSIYEPEYGTVHKSSKTGAHVTWPDGSTSVHRHSDGAEHGDKSTYHSPSGPNKSIRLPSGKTPEEHVAQTRDYAATANAAKEHERRAHSVQEKIKSLHHTSLTHEHLSQLEKIHAEASKPKE